MPKFDEDRPSTKEWKEIGWIYCENVQKFQPIWVRNDHTNGCRNIRKPLVNAQKQSITSKADNREELRVNTAGSQKQRKWNEIRSTFQQLF